MDDSKNIEIKLRDRLEADLRKNLFDSNLPGSVNVDVTLTISMYEALGGNCKWGWKMPISLVFSSNAQKTYKYDEIAETCSTAGLFPPMPDFCYEVMANGILEKIEDIKKKIGEDGLSASESNRYTNAPVKNNIAGRMNIAVSDLSAEGVSQSNASIVADWLRGSLVSAGTYTVVERSAMQKILTEQAFQQTGCTSQECAVKLGKMLNVQRMVVGSFGKFLDSYVLNVRVVDIESGEVVYSDSANGATTKEVEANIKALALRLSK